MEVQEASSFEANNTWGNDKISKAGNVPARNMNTKRAFGSELTNLAPNQMVSVESETADGQMKPPAEKRLKRNSSAAELNIEQGPPLKKCRYNSHVTVVDESDVENTKNDEKDKNEESLVATSNENDKNVDMSHKNEHLQSGCEDVPTGEDIKSCLTDTNTAAESKTTTTGIEQKKLEEEEEKEKVEGTCAPLFHVLMNNCGEYDVADKEGLSLNIVRQKIATYLNEIQNPAKWDIDDVHNDLACVHYVNDITRRLEETEHAYVSGEHQDYMSWQKEINIRMRVTLLDWLVEVHRKFKLLPPTLYLCTNLLDRYLSGVQVAKNNLQLVGCACLWLASKYHEIYAPEIRDFVFISDDAFTKEELVKQESAIVDQLKFQLTLPTPLAFAERFLKIGSRGGMTSQNEKIIRSLAFYLLEHGLMKYELARILPSKLAAACLAYSLLATNSYTFWPKFLEEETRYSMKELFPIIESIDTIVKTDSKLCKHKAVRKKYASERFFGVSSLDFLKVDVKKFMTNSTK